MGLDRARALADAVLYEGYLLYPYRAAAAKNALRWQFGVLMPPAAADDTVGEYADSRTECLLEAPAGAVLSAELRFLHVRHRDVRDAADRSVEALPVDGADVVAWDEATERTVPVELPLADVLAGPVTVPVAVAGDAATERVPGGRIVRTHEDLRGELTLSAAPLPGPYGGIRLRADVRNTTPWTPDGPPERAYALRRALVAAHLLLAVRPGGFLSLTDPPEWAAGAAHECDNVRTWPVLAGEPGDPSMVLSSPIILDDHPRIAPESQIPLYDGTEIDEILTLRTMALTEDEKRAARATDARARELIDAVDDLPPELLDRLHGTVRYLREATAPVSPPTWSTPGEPWWDPAADSAVDPERDRVTIGGVDVGRGSRVVLHPRSTGTDAQDMFLAGRSGTVHAVLSDVDGGCHLAVTLDDDPGADLSAVQGRFRYFAPDEVEPDGGAP